MGGIGRLLFERHAYDLPTLVGRDLGLASRPGGILLNAGQAKGGIAFAPAGHFETADAQLRGDLEVLQSIGSQQNNADTLSQAHRNSLPSAQADKLFALLISKFNDGGGSHSVTRYTPSSYVTRLMADHTSGALQR